MADDLVAGDLNQTQNIFVYRVVAAPQLIVLGPSANGAITLQWDASPGQGYQVQFKADLQSTTWEIGSEPIAITGSKASWMEPSTAAAAQRFYRVVLLE